MPTITTVELNEGKAPGAIQYMPPGEHVICPSINGQAQQVRVIVNKQTAARLQADLESRLAAAKAGATRPCGYFDHKAGAASFIPTGFSWDDEKGVILSVEWTNAGRAAVEGRDYSYFSPFVNYSPKTGEILGMCSSAEIGSLVNDPAFPVERLAAARAELAPQQDDDKKHLACENGMVLNNPATMDEIIKALGLEAGADTAAIVAAIEALKQPKENKEKDAAFSQAVAEKETAEKERDEAKADKEKAEKELAAARATIESLNTAAEEAFINEQIRAGRVKPQDEATLAAARALFKANPDAARTIYSSMPSATETTLAGGKTAGEPAKTVTREDIVNYYNS